LAGLAEAVDDALESGVDALVVVGGNGQSIGGGMRIVQEAVLDDGLLDLFIVSRLSKRLSGLA
jgi:diacylglycerol kinase family enzyme